jgi:hypothetical protein
MISIRRGYGQHRAAHLVVGENGVGLSHALRNDRRVHDHRVRENFAVDASIVAASDAVEDEPQVIPGKFLDTKNPVCNVVDQRAAFDNRELFWLHTCGHRTRLPGTPLPEILTYYRHTRNHEIFSSCGVGHLDDFQSVRESHFGNTVTENSGCTSALTISGRRVSFRQKFEQEQTDRQTSPHPAVERRVPLSPRRRRISLRLQSRGRDHVHVFLPSDILIAVEKQISAPTKNASASKPRFITSNLAVSFSDRERLCICPAEHLTGAPRSFSFSLSALFRSPLAARARRVRVERPILSPATLSHHPEARAT